MSSIKGTNIETGEKHIQMVNCALTLTISNLTTFGRFNVRLFANNNRTACRYCNRTNHPSYKCDIQTCHGCDRERHIKYDCTYQKGDTERTEQEMYGNDVHDIRV